MSLGKWSEDLSLVSPSLHQKRYDLKKFRYDHQGNICSFYWRVLLGMRAEGSQVQSSPKLSPFPLWQLAEDNSGMLGETPRHHRHVAAAIVTP